MTIRATLLGTGGSAGVPHIGGPDGRGEWGACDPNEPRNQRSRCSILLQNGTTTLLVDTSPDMRSQLLRAGIARVDAVLYTHAHADHIVGLDDVRILNRNAGRALEAFASPATMAEIQIRFGYAFRPWEGGHFYRPVLLPRVVERGSKVQVGSFSLHTFDQDHGYSRSLGFRVGNLGYATDVVRLDEMAFSVLAGVDTWIVGCFQRRQHVTHAWLERVLQWSERVKPRRTVLTHMGNDMDWAWLQAHLPPGVEPGCDGMVVEVG
jgi:phosphoribosyl 1,2-cyclic phosphate phosphodiesterase